MIPILKLLIMVASELKLSIFSNTVSSERTLSIKSLTDPNLRMNTNSSSSKKSPVAVDSSGLGVPESASFESKRVD